MLQRFGHLSLVIGIVINNKIIIIIICGLDVNTNKKIERAAGVDDNTMIILPLYEKKRT